MKSIVSLIALAAIALTASAQNYAPVQLSGIPSSQTAATNLATPVVLDVRRQQNVALAITQSSVSDGQTNTLTFCRSVDGSAYDTNNTINVTVLSPGGGSRTTVTNLNPQGAGYLVLTKLTPTGSGGLTQTVKYAIKPNAP